MRYRLQQYFGPEYGWLNLHTNLFFPSIEEAEDFLNSLVEETAGEACCEIKAHELRVVPVTHYEVTSP